MKCFYGGAVDASDTVGAKKFRTEIAPWSSEGYIPENPIAYYATYFQENKEKIAHDIDRNGDILIHTPSGDYEVTGEIVGARLKELGGNTVENRITVIDEIVSKITKNPDLQTYLRTQLTQFGFAQMSENVLAGEVMALAHINSTIPKTTKRLSRILHITAHDDTHLTVLSQAVFSDKIHGLVGAEVNPTPLSICNVTLDIRLDASLPGSPSISITPLAEIYVVPGRENLFEKIYTDFIKNFQKEERPIEKIDAKKVELLAPTTGFNAAIYERGLSFIAAAKLIADNSPIDDEFFTQDKKIELQKKLDSLENFWKVFCVVNNNLTKEDLAKLEKVLIEKIQTHLYPKDKDGNTRSFKEVKIELDNAENHVNWKKREAHRTKSEAKATVERTETPIMRFTPEQETEWLRILENAPPAWFSRLQPWEQNYFRGQVQTRQKPEENLGEFLGSVPSTIRRYPGAPNAYVTSVEITPPRSLVYKKDGQEDLIIERITFTKIRSGVLVPFNMEVENKRDREEKRKITLQNLEQLVAAAIIEAIKSGKDFSNGSLPILLQTLYSPPIEPPGNENNPIMMHAFRTLRDYFGEPNPNQENFQKFLEKHGINNEFLKANGIDKSLTIKSVTLLYSNRPVNIARGISWIWNRLSEQGRESRKTDKRFRDLAEERLKRGPDDPILRAALDSYNRMPYRWNTLFGTLSAEINPMAERAALEQIIAGQLGIRIGSCKSGKDREEMVTQIAIAQLQYFTIYKKFPPPYNVIGHARQDRDHFITLVARAYLTGHGQKLAGENAKGCDALKDIPNVLGRKIWDRIAKIEDKSDPIASAQQIASLNKLSASRLIKVSVEKFKKKWEAYRSAHVPKEPKVEKEEPASSPQSKRKSVFTPSFGRQDSSDGYEVVEGEGPSPSTPPRSDSSSSSRARR